MGRECPPTGIGGGPEEVCSTETAGYHKVGAEGENCIKCASPSSTVGAMGGVWGETQKTISNPQLNTRS